MQTHAHTHASKYKVHSQTPLPPAAVKQSKKSRNKSISRGTFISFSTVCRVRLLVVGAGVAPHADAQAHQCLQPPIEVESFSRPETNLTGFANLCQVLILRAHRVHQKQDQNGTFPAPIISPCFKPGLGLGNKNFKSISKIFSTKFPSILQ